MRRRGFLKSVALASGLSPALEESQAQPAARAPAPKEAFSYPRMFSGNHLAMIAFPLGGIGAGSISLGGRGQLRDWEIFNRPDKGLSPAYAFASLWVRLGNDKPIARVLEARILPPYEGSSGLGSNNSPGLPRLEAATFRGEYPLAGIEFQDSRLPVKVALEAFSPFFPLEADDSSLPLAVLRYRVKNPGMRSARVSIAWAIDNPVGLGAATSEQRAAAGKRVNEVYQGDGWQGLRMTNPGLDSGDVLQGNFVLGLWRPQGTVSQWRGWPKGRWWNSPMLFWDAFSASGSLGAEPSEQNQVATLCLQREIAPGAEADYTFLLAWHFPNRTPERCGWRAPAGAEKTVIGNWYAARFPNAAAVADYAAPKLEALERRTRSFAAAMRESTLPAAVKDGAMSNLSTLVTQTCFRTADGEFHAFEGSNDKLGCCFGNCTHVWNYETATPFLFPSLSRSLRRGALGYALDDAGAIHFRQLLPDGKERSGFAAADGQMGQIMKVYLDWKVSGDTAWLREIWPRTKKALEFAWVPGGWDADRDGVLEGVQHNTYDVEFYGPNPQCGICYLGALRAGEEMARIAGDDAAAQEYRRLFENGRKWIDGNLFNGEFYIQKVQGTTREKIAPNLTSDMGSAVTENPEYQVGDGCLVDQLMGQYLAEVCGLGPLIDPAHARKALESIYRYNYKRHLFDHESVQRTFALNDEAALVICDYGKGQRPRIPFPYYAEVMTGFEYAAAAHMIYAGMTRQGVECLENIRRRYDGERRNPWDEAECGHHYARAMAAWSAVLALSGFTYTAAQGRIQVTRNAAANSRCLWSSGKGWGVFSWQGPGFHLAIRDGELRVGILELATSVPMTGAKVRVGKEVVPAKIETNKNRFVVRLETPVTCREDTPIAVEV
jgi:non-lysosomal glucosylceramidase